jgi:tetratricopeptide (TPR) repeat protein
VHFYQLGIVYQKNKDFEAAEQAYREAARLWEENGLLGGNGAGGAGASWQQLAQICEATGRQAEAEQWYGKALAAFQGAKDQPNAAITLGNLAVLLTQPAWTKPAAWLRNRWLSRRPLTRQQWSYGRPTIFLPTLPASRERAAKLLRTAPRAGRRILLFPAGGSSFGSMSH